MRRLFLALLFLLPSISFLSAAELTPEGKEQIESDWLFQCDNAPTFEKAKFEITRARELADRMADLDDAPEFPKELKALADLEMKIAAAKETPELAKQYYFEVRKIKRAIVFANPLINFDKIVLIDNPYPKGKKGDATDEWGHEARHRNGFMAEPGGRLLVVGLNPGEPVQDVLKGKEGSFWRPDVSYDMKKLLFSFQPKGEKSFHLYECALDGSGLKQLTFGDYDDLDPIYSPDGKIIFCSSRQHSYVRCMPMTHSFAVSRCDADGKNIYVISANGEPEYLPSMLNDGRVLFTRWEYTDKALWRVQSLWSMNPDGTNTQTFWGNQSVWPDVLTEARAVPNSSKVFFIGLGHHAWFDGSLGIIDPSVGLNYPLGLERITREVNWAEVGNGPEDPAPKVDYHAAGKFYAYKSPYPLSEEYFLVSAREGKRLYSGDDHGWFFRLYMMDIYGNKELVYKGKYNAYYAMPLVKREYPVKPDTVKWPKIGSDEKPAPGVLYSNNVFEGAPAVLKEKGKAIRVIQMDPKTYTTWHKTVQHDGPAISVFQADGVKRILGTVPIEKDGSINFEVPAGEAIFFEMLDEQGRAIHVMRTFTNVMPGERRGCVGCHESQHATQQNIAAAGAQVGDAIRKAPAKLTPPSWGAGESIGFERFVQKPVLDKYCAKCHQNPEHEAYKKLNMVWRPSAHGWWATVHHRPDDVSPFNEPYLTMVTGKTRWGLAKERDERNVPRNIAGLFIVEAYSGTDPENLKTLPPYSAYSPVSKLVHNAMSGEHNGVKVEGEDLARLIAWVDCNGPYLGDEEVRKMYDPQTETVAAIPPIYPRIGTAPRINRFNIRQDGNTKAMLGDLRLLPNAPKEFNPNKRVHDFQLKEASDELKKGVYKVELVNSNYGSDEYKIQKNVLEQLKKYFNGSRMIDLNEQKYNTVFGDPAPQKVKTLRIDYRINNSPVKHVVFKENELILLPK
ncbi:MAG: hypothetical protein Q4G69_13670 [Planctomycetia bacterium]|nr:hypothetical protein [Planctomycetia bacterium]